METKPIVIDSFEPILLSELGHTNLLNRVDSKYVFKQDQLPNFLGWLSGNYRVLEVNNHRSISYNSVYFDTPNFTLYHEHHCGKKNRLKIRFRNYVENDLTFFEIKFKTNRGRTLKSRMSYPGIENAIQGQAKHFLESQTNLLATNLRAVLSVHYKRITLVHRKLNERITFDTDIRFENEFGSLMVPHLTLAEVKQERSERSLFTSLMKSNDIHEGFISKYCFGLAGLVPKLRKNNFKKMISKISTTSLCQ